MGVYSEIKLLLKDLNDTKVKVSRQAAEKLQRLLSQPESRRKLANEVSIPSSSDYYYRATSSNTTARSNIGSSGSKRQKVSSLSSINVTGARKVALSEVWNIIIRKSLVAVQAIVDGKSKATEVDIQLPFNLLRLCDLQITDDDNDYVIYTPIDPSSSSLSSFQSKSCQQQQQQQKYYWSSKLDKITVREVFEYCMEMLDNDIIIELCEINLLQFLSYICTRRDFVAYFKPTGEINAILEEVMKRLIPNSNNNYDDGNDDNDERNHRYERISNNNNIVLETSKIFENIIQTTIEIGIGMELFIPVCVEMICKWCRNNNSNARNMNGSSNIIGELPHLFNGISLLLQSNPEQSIMPLTRHGRTILSFIKKYYKNTIPSHRTAMNKYLIRHLITAQVAGKLSGMMPGDLGDLGSASISSKQLYTLLDLVHNDLGKYTTNDIQSIEISHKVHIELFVRLLSAAQRMYLNTTQWDRIGDNPIKEIITLIEKSEPYQRNNLLYIHKQQHDEQIDIIEKIPSAKLSIVDISKSPFVTYILGPLYSIAPGSFITSTTSDDNKHSSDDTKLGTNPILLEAAAFVAASSSPPSTKIIDHRTDNTKMIITIIQTLFVCADMFPTGSCWTSNASKGWRHLQIPSSSSKKIATTTRKTESFFINFGSDDDLASILLLLSNVLELYGGSTFHNNTTPILQKWILLCLIRLAEASAVIRISENEQRRKDSFCAHLQSVWRRIWMLLFRPDLRYMSSTKSITNGGIGDLVVLLLIYMIRYDCTDIQQVNNNTFSSTTTVNTTAINNNVSFLYNHQSDFWTMPLFANNTVLRDDSPLPFALIYSVMLFSGLRDGQGVAHNDLSNRSTVRQNLLQICIRFVEKSVEKTTSRQSICLASFCIAALCSGRSPTPDFTFTYVGDYIQSIAPSLLDLTCISDENDNILEHLVDDQRDVNYFLWASTPTCPAPLKKDSLLDLYLDNVIHNIVQMRTLLGQRESGRKSADRISQALSRQLVASSFQDVRKLLQIDTKINVDTSLSPSESKESSGASNEPKSIFTLSGQTLAAKVLLTLIPAYPNDELDSVFVGFLKDVSLILHEIGSKINDDESNQDDLALACTDLVGICNAILFFLAQRELNVPKQFIESFVRLYESCKVLLERYRPGCVVSESPTNSQRNKADDLLMEDDSDGEQAPVQKKVSMRNLDSDDDTDEDISDRKRKRQDYRQGKETKKSRGSRVIKQQLAFGTASLLLTLCPTFDDCEFVAKSLSGVGSFDDENATSLHNVDILGILFSLELLCAEGPFFHHTAKTKILRSDTEKEVMSLPSLVCHMIKFTRMIAEPFSDFFLLGFDKCARLVCLGDSRFRYNRLSEDEAMEIVDLIRGSETDRRFLTRRSVFRSEQIKAAVTMYVRGKANFQSVFGKEFPRAIVLPSLVDVNGPIRRRACDAVSAAMQMHSEEHLVIEIVRKRLPPMTASREENAVKADFKNWYIDKTFQSQETSVIRESQVWDDSFASFQCSYLECMGTIAIQSSNVQTQQQVLSDLIQLASFRVDLEGIIIQLIEQISSFYGHRSSQSFLEMHREALLLKWIESGRNLNELPLLLTAPHIISLLLRQGYFHKLLFIDEPDAARLQHNIIDDVKEVAVSDFLVRNCDALFPQILALAVKTVPDSEYINDSFLNNKYVQEISSFFEDSQGGSIIKTLTRKHFVNTAAQAFIMRAVADYDGRENRSLLNVVKNVLSEEVYHRQLKRTAGAVARRIIDLAGDFSEYVGLDAAFDTLQTLIEVFRSGPSRDDPLEVLGSSATELLVFVKFLLDACVNEKELERRWSSFEVVVRFIKDRIRLCASEKTQLGFCVHLLLGILVNERLASVHKLTFGALNAIVNAITESNRQISDSNLIKDIIYVSFSVHENYQRKLVELNSSLRNMESQVLVRSLGIIPRWTQSATEVDHWGWTAEMPETFRSDFNAFSLSEFQSDVSHEIVESLSASFLLLHDITVNSSHIGLSRDVMVFLPLDSLAINEQQLLSKLNPYFCAQNVVRQYLSDGSENENLQSTQKVPLIISRIKRNTHRQVNSGLWIRICSEAMNAISFPEIKPFLCLN